MLEITEEQFKYFAEKQEKLDSFMRIRRDITLDEWDNDSFYVQAHIVALKNEVSEFVNECRDIWKYWKDKKVDIADLKDELVDVIHFLHIEFNKQIRMGVDVEFLVKHINGLSYEMSDKTPINILYRLETNNSPFTIYGGLLAIADKYNLTLDEIKEAYDIKNKENFDRQKRSY